MQIVLPKLKQWQRDVYEKVSGQGGTGNIFVLKSPRQRGKSVLANALLVSYLLSNKCTCVVIEPTISQSRRMFKQLYDWLIDSGAITSSNATLLEMSFASGSEVLFKSAEMRDNLRGFTVTRNGLLVIDEGAFIRDDIYEIVYPIVDACKAPMLVISTPLFRRGEFYNLYERGLSDKFPNVTTFDWTDGYDMSDMLSPDKLEYYRQTMSRLKFQSEILGQFLDTDSALFGDLASVIGPLSLKPAKYCGIDWSTGTGNDWLAVVFMDEDKAVTDIIASNEFDATDIIKTIAGELIRRPTLEKILVEQNSIGSVFMSMLKKATANKIKSGALQSFVTTNESKREIIDDLITAVQTGGLRIPNDKELVWELQHYSAERTQTGKLTYNGVGAHDDYVIATALCLKASKRTGGKLQINFA